MRIKYIMDGTQPAFKRRRDMAGLGAVVVCLALMGGMAISAAAQTGPVETPKQVATTQVKTKQVKTKHVNHVTSPMVSGRLTSKFGPTKDPFNANKTRNHHGIDIAAPTGTPIYAPADGIIRDATKIYKGKPNYGLVISLETEGGILTVFTHLDSYSVASGDRVTKGTQIAMVGSSGKSTGPHVHIETYKNGRRVDPQTIWDVTPN